MKTSFRNCQGVGNPLTGHNLRGSHLVSRVGSLWLGVQVVMLVLLVGMFFYLHCTFVNHDDNAIWHLIGIYLNVCYVDRVAQLCFLSNYINQLRGCIIVGEDFNCVSNINEKQGRNRVSANRLQALNDFILSSQLQDLGFSGHPFTWNNRRRGNDNIQMRLDRVLASVEWLDRYSSGVVHHLSELGSDHRPLLLDSCPNTVEGKFCFV
ncbi:uncharacterized protein LOC126656806 [Mercurialis annua]|uniref:uncharacterized protein LOC126656806 n=1 Tax=Mercurialis annua TaxID=3986 RepID=UPI00215F74BF|nr:uncharacterized protein LOC126656806 [Mercurialis annua]